MISVLYEPFPESITVGGKEFAILTDFRDWVRFADLIADKALSAAEKLSVLPEWFEQPPDIFTDEMLYGMFDFYHAKQLEPDPEESDEDDSEAPAKPPLFDWKWDGKCVLGDFRRFYGIDLLRVDYLHWWEFRSLFAALPDESLCAKRIAIRGTDLSKIKNKAERNRIAFLQKQLALPFASEDETIGNLLWNMDE